MPNRENIRKWVDALRSGEFTQAVGALRHVQPENRASVGFCCLGVACEMYRREFGGDWLDTGAFLGSTGILPPEVRRWLEVPDENPGVARYEDIRDHSLAARNDNGATFAEIADLIEREWLTEGEG